MTRRGCETEPCPWVYGVLMSMRLGTHGSDAASVRPPARLVVPSDSPFAPPAAARDRAGHTLALRAASPKAARLDGVCVPAGGAASLPGSELWNDDCVRVAPRAPRRGWFGRESAGLHEGTPGRSCSLRDSGLRGRTDVSGRIAYCGVAVADGGRAETEARAVGAFVGGLPHAAGRNALDQHLVRDPRESVERIAGGGNSGRDTQRDRGAFAGLSGGDCAGDWGTAGLC